MPAYPTPALLKAEIVRRVRGGETVKAICAGDPRMPCAESVSIWARRDPAFAAEMADARRRGDWARRFAYDEAVAEAFFVRVRAGARIGDLIGRPGMPGAATYRYWRRTQVAFQWELARLRGLRYERLKGIVSRRRWEVFDPAVADRILVRTARGEGWARFLDADPDVPHRQAADRWRRQHPEWAAAMRIAISVGRRARARMRMRLERDAIGARACEAIAVEGESLRSLARRRDMPSAATFYKWKRLFPDFARQVADAYDFNAWMEADRALAESPYYEILTSHLPPR